MLGIRLNFCLNPRDSPQIKRASDIGTIEKKKEN